ncbi:MAG TPA: outer membrane beta-barrel protein [Longimicrobiales bacterium]
MGTLRAVVAVGALAAALPATAPAQTHALDRGSFRVGGTASFTSAGGEVDGDPVDRETQLTLAPSVQYFLLPGLAVGGNLSLSRRGFGDDDAVTSYGIGPAVTYYFGADDAADQDWFPYIDAGIRYVDVQVDDAILGSEEPSVMGYNAAAGILFLLSPAVGMTGELFYDRSDLENNIGTDTRADTFGLAFGISAFVF